MKFNLRKILKVSLLLIAFAMSMAILSACNGAQSTLPSEHFEGNCIKKGYTRYYKANGTYVDREDSYFGDHSYDDGTTLSVLSCTTNGETKFTCTICKDERIETVAKLGHDYKETDRIDATCTEDGRVDFECNRCHAASTEVLDMLGHDYDERITKAPTCSEKGIKDLHCKRCDFDTTAEIPTLEHDYFELVLKEPTCTEKGKKSMTCLNCGSTATEDVEMLPHTQDGEIRLDDEGHWYVCSVCDNAYGYGVHNNETTKIAATCINHAYTHIKCRDCSYYVNVIDENSKLSHRYEAYTCVGCQRDKLLDYKAEFDSKGADATNLIDIESEEMFVCFYDYLIAYQITTPKHIKLSYITLKSDGKVNEVNAYLQAIRRKITATNWSVRTSSVSNPLTNNLIYLSMHAADSDNFVFDEAASYTPNDYPTEYKNSAFVQYQSYQFEKAAPRSAGFDDFAYKSRINEMSVSSSDQLFFAFEHGYKPVAKSGSSAYKMLNAAKAVARRIMNDGMSELEKVRAIYGYLISDVAYDHGIVELTNDTDSNVHYAKCSSYYLEGVFNYGLAVCDGISKAYCVLAGLEDIKCVRVTSDNHAWNKVYIDVDGDGEKTWFGSDATWGNQGVNYNDEMGEFLSLEDFLFTDAQKTKRKQIGRNYTDTDSNATTEENPFAYFYFDEAKDASCDFVITSGDELSTLIEYLKANWDGFKRGDIVTVNIFIVTAYLTKDNITTTVYGKLRSQWFVVYATSALTVGDNEISYGEVSGYSVSIIIPKL